MASYLSVAGQCRSAFLQIHALDDGVFAEFPLNVQHGLLRLFFPFKHGLFVFPARVYSRVIRKKVKLLNIVHFLNTGLIHNMIRCDIDSSDKEVFVGDALKQCCDGIQNELCR